MEDSIEEQSQVLPIAAVNIDSLGKILQIIPGTPIENHDHKCPIPKVPPLLRRDKNNQQDYDPMVVSLGPYHHGKEELQLVEDFKMTALQIIVNRCDKGADYIYSQVFQRVNDARNYYIKDSTERYDDVTFAQMMLLDSCFLISTIDLKNFEVKRLGAPLLEMIYRDILLLENQIPFWLLKLLICLAYEKGEGEDMLNRYLYETCLGNYEASGRAWPDEDLPHHLLGACWLILVPESTLDKSTPRKFRPRNGFGCLNHLPNFGKYSHLLHKYTGSLPCFPRSRSNGDDWNVKKHIYHCRSAMDLKAKGIHFKPSSSDTLTSIKFKSHHIYASLEVPVRIVDPYFKSFFLNMIAHEMCANTFEDRVVAAFFEFMKSLIDSPKDVKELREKAVLLTVVSDEEVVKVFKEINTHAPESVVFFQDVKQKIQNHYNSKAKTWLAELIYTHFRSPWTAIALIAAAFLGVLTCVQTYYAVRPR